MSWAASCEWQVRSLKWAGVGDCCLDTGMTVGSRQCDAIRFGGVSDRQDTRR
jgi:hypothetical protein